MVVDRAHKLVRRYHVSDAALHQSPAMDDLLMQGNTAFSVWVDVAYRSQETDAKLRTQRLKSLSHRKSDRNRPLTDEAKGRRQIKSTVRVQIWHVFGVQANDMGGTLVRTIGMLRAKAKIGMKHLAYNMRCVLQLRRLDRCPA